MYDSEGERSGAKRNALACHVGAHQVVANLWDVTDRDIDRFCKALVQAWQQQAVGCARQPAAAAGIRKTMPCMQGPVDSMHDDGSCLREMRAEGVAETMQVMSIADGQGGLMEMGVVGQKGSGSTHRMDAGNVRVAMREARGACKLHFLTGAAPVCYGLPVQYI